MSYARCPNALKYTGVYEMLPDILKEYVEKVDRSEQAEMLRQLAALTEESDFDKAVEALTKCLEYGSMDADSVLSVYTGINAEFPLISEAKTPMNMPSMSPLKNDLKSYDRLID